MLGLQFSARIKNAVILYMCVYIYVYTLSTLFSHVKSKSQEDRICNVNFGDTQTKVSPETVTRFDIKQMYKYSAISTFLPVGERKFERGSRSREKFIANYLITDLRKKFPIRS